MCLHEVFFLQFLAEFLTAFLFKDISKIGGQVSNLLAKYTVALMHLLIMRGGYY